MSTPDPSAAPAAAPARKARQSAAEYRWTMPKVVAFLEALARCGRVAEAARAVGMSRQAAYRLRARLAGTRYGPAFENARRAGIRARAEASRARARSQWEGEMLADYLRRQQTSQGDSAAAQGDTAGAIGDTARGQGEASLAKGTEMALDCVTGVTPPARRHVGKGGAGHEKGARA